MILVRPVHRGRRRGRLPRSEGNPDLRGRQGFARGARRAGHGPPCVGGASELEIDLEARTVSVNGTELAAGDLIAIDGSTGDVTTARRAAGAPGISDHFETVLDWADELRRLGVRANADTPEDARRARELRCRRHRPLPHGAHVHGGRPPAEDAGDDHGLDGGGAPGRAGRAAAAPAGRLRGPLRGDGRTARSRSGCSTRRCTSSCRTRRSWCWTSSARSSRGRSTRDEDRGAGAPAGACARAGGGEPDARDPRLPARNPPPRDL